MINLKRRAAALVGAVTLAGVMVSASPAATTTAEAGRYKAAPGGSGAVTASTSKELLSINNASASGDPKVKFYSTKARADAGQPNYIAAGARKTTLRYSIDRSPNGYGGYWKTIYNGGTTIWCIADAYHVLPLKARESIQVFVLQKYAACAPGAEFPMAAGKTITYHYVGKVPQGRYGTESVQVKVP